jgi:TRAP transporter TAXI family solute receptor
MMKKTQWGCIAGATLAAFLVLPANAADRTYIIGTSPQGSLAFATGNALSKVVDAKAGLTLRTRATGGSSTVVPQINRGQIDFGLSNALETGQGYVGKGPFEGRPQKNLLVASTLYPLQTAYAVANDSKIRKLQDAKGMRIPTKFTSQTTFTTLTDALLASAGLRVSEFEGVPVSNYIKGGDFLAQGKVDLAIVAPGSGGSRKQHAELRNRGGMRFISIGEDIDAMRKHFREAYPRTLKADKSIPGLVEDITLMAYPFYVVTGKHVPEDVIYKIVKVMHENKDELTKAFAPFRNFDPKDQARPHSSVSFHPGAIKYYKEIGIWQGQK